MEAAIIPLQINLQTLSQLTPGQRICMRNQYFVVEATSIYTAPKRFLFGDNRESIVAVLESMYPTALHMMKSFPEMRENISKSVLGLQSLKKTYDGDPTVESRISVLIQGITSELNRTAANTTTSKSTPTNEIPKLTESTDDLL
jgi:hypothetical protein